ncbi:kinesin heavy chain isoform X4 [Parasteatoda tepidariorum]|uniref:kinesin heavy chain isoform X4 n=1 Tax=Parasteatoda tepidariorum TaxID=114398 RepID=UPI001C7287E6|nr:kinesin heavy chain isoform X4 [Parasteatoda tepidariorum]
MASQQSIKVCCRVHGENEYNKETLEHGYSFLDSKSILHLSSGRIYTFDKIFDSCSSQSQIYNEVAKPIVFNVLSGYNGAILVYGHTSSDKAYTMEGVAFGNEKSGIIPRIAHDIFSHTESLEDSLKWEIKISFYEIYLEKVRDLFDDSEDTLQVYDDRKGSPFIVGGKEILVKNIREVMEFFNEAKLKRHVAYSDTNEMISRSHTIFQIVIKQENLVSHEKMTGKLLLVDLAGSEQVLTSVLTNDSIVNRESRCINMSLSVLSRVILLLTEKRDGIPYRESVLTRLLKESLGGNSQTAIIVCIRPSSEKRIKWSLEFGCRAKIIKNNFYLNVKHDRKKPSRIWEKFQRYISSTNQYISGSIAELQKWRSGKAVPAEEWIPFINCNENSFSDSYLTDTSLMDTSFIDTSDIVHSVHEQSNSQILSDSSFLDTFNLSLNESFTIPDYEDGNSLQSQIEIMKRQQLQSPHIECKPTESAIADDIEEQSNEEMLPFPHIECKPESEIADDIKEQSDEEMLPSPLIECKPIESAIVEDIKEQSDEEMLPLPHIECKPESVIVDDIKEHSDEETLPSTLIECKRTESEIVDDIKEQSDEETLPSPLIECKPTESVIVDDIKEQSEEEMLQSPQTECKPIESAIVDDIKEQSEEEMLQSPQTECKPTESAIVDDIKEQSDEEMTELKEELEFHKKQTITLHQSLERVTQELKSQRDISDELSSALKMERKKNMLEEAHRKNYLQEINNFKEVRNNILELLARENAKNIDFQTLRSLKEIKPSHIEKLEPITVEDLKATLRAENMQNRISELSARFESLSESCLQRNRKHASRDSVNEKISLLQAEIVSLEKNQGTNEQTLNERIAEKIQKVNVEGFNELLLDDSIQSCDLKSRGHYIHLSQKYDQQKQKTAEVIAERDAAKESLISLEKEVRNLSERHDTEKQALNAEIDKMSRDIERLNLELRKELYIKCEHNSNLDGLKKEVKDASKTVRILSDKICVLENDLDMERNRSKEDTARMEIILLEKANTINVLVTRLCCLEQENRTLIEELQKTHYCKQMLQEESDNVLTILKNFSNRSHYEGESLCGNEMVNSEPMLLNEDHCDLVNANFNEISSFELSLRIKLVTELKRLFYECENIAALQGSPSSKNPDDSFDGKESLKDAIEYFQDCAESDSVLQNINIHEISTSELFLMSNSLEHVDSLETLPGVPLDYAESMEVANISEGITGNYQIEENVIITEQTGVEGHS